jgi:hypothetical protein
MCLVVKIGLGSEIPKKKFIKKVLGSTLQPLGQLGSLQALGPVVQNKCCHQLGVKSFS